MRRHVAVIGAGAAGLITAKELRAAGHAVQVYERTGDVGGVWKYTDEVDSDVLGRNPQRRQVHSSMYRYLRTNLPREVMGFVDFPFVPDMMGSFSRDARRFCSHEEVQAYLEAFTAHFDLRPLVKFNTEVLSIAPRAIPQANAPSISSAADEAAALPPADKSSCASAASSSNCSTASGVASSSAAGVSAAGCWQLHARTTAPATSCTAGADSEGFWQDVDAVVVCNGHYSEPQLPDVAGMDSFPGHQMHSHNYRDNSHYTGQVVLIVGASNSGEDISREVSEVACRVLLSARTWQRPDLATDPHPYGPGSNIYRRPMVTRLRADGGAVFEDGRLEERVDAVIYCTGYRYSFPFLQHTGLVSAAHGHVAPLYKHMFPPAAAPSLSLIGLPWKVVPFPLFQCQAKYLARLLSGEARALPSPKEMAASAEAFYKDLRERGIPERYTHRMSEEQWAYCDWLADSAGSGAPRLERWREGMYVATGALKRGHQEGYRDGAWPDPGMLEVVERDLAGVVAAAKGRAVRTAAAAGT